jgi:serine/threonine protein kinase
MVAPLLTAAAAAAAAAAASLCVCVPQVKVCDFNLSRMVAQQQQLANSGNPNSPAWQSPELLAGQPYGKAADVFSFGVVLWEIMTLKEPWR